ncbi:ester cyclase [Jannaschia ovalis]|uniref:Ester cyclase n=1 Tax=Jannaschia ovalis TaxID=3038773 RepID=A0ABY8L987_9RHOB|nr:ester cyclase [Jannaschia sp. GRR-S6-38]WGH77920.1 ester cyclase [Jannaschia sp. GRR-S6-38]
MTDADEGFRRSAWQVLARWTAGEDVLAADLAAEAAAPFGRLDAAGLGRLTAELRRALPDLERRDDIFLAGANHPDDRWQAPRPPRVVACLGSYLGTFREPFAGIPPTGGVVTLPFGEAHAIEDGRIRASWLIWDLPALMRQAGCWPMSPPLGAPGHWPGPRGGGGVRLAPSPETGALASVLEMHAVMNAFDGGDIATIDMRHWHPDFTYWAGGNIGACRGVAGFRAHHQVPYRRAFRKAQGAGHFARLSDGPFAMTGGDVAVTHDGADYMGLPATGRAMRFRVMDFYRFGSDGLIAENWLPNDTIGLMAQMGVDVMARMRHLTGQPRLTL